MIQSLESEHKFLADEDNPVHSLKRCTTGLGNPPVTTLMGGRVVRKEGPRSGVEEVEEDMVELEEREGPR